MLRIPATDPSTKSRMAAAASDARWPGADQVAQPILNLLLAIGDQLFLGRKVVVDGLLGDLGLARHVSDGNVLIATLGEQAGRGVGDEPPGTRLLALPQSRTGHTESLAGTRSLDSPP